MSKVADIFILFGAMTVGGLAVWFWNGEAKKAEDKLVLDNLTSGIRQPVVDVSKLGIHGAIIAKLAAAHQHHHHEGEVEHDDDETPIAPELQKEIDAAEKVEREVFDTPGGAYTAEDIARNGKIPPYERFGDVLFLNSMKPFPGNPSDPITKTKTHPAFDWYVNSKLYHFSCIPSLEEFVMRAKKDPASVQPPEKFIEPPKSKS